MFVPNQDPPVTNHTLIIEPGLAERHYWRDLWRYRVRFFVLAWRDANRRPVSA